jgi:hypothetical protein
MSHAHAIQSLREEEHISSAALDEALILFLRPCMPADTALLLCADAYFMTRTDMVRYQRRIKTVIDAYTTTLIPLFDSVHWFLAAVNTATRTFTFYNSYGRHGQRKWSPALKTWLTKHIHGLWTAAQVTATQPSNQAQPNVAHTHF